MNILIIGSGGREHTLAWKLLQSPKCTKLYVLPGNAGTAGIAENIEESPDNFDSIANICLQKKVGLIVVGPEAPLVAGIADFFKNNSELSHIMVIGPDKKGAQLEGSKDFSKAFMHKYGIPTASSKTFTIDTLNEGLLYLEDHPLPIVLKADGLASGKGVIIAENKQDASDALKDMLSNRKFGEASAKVVIEQYLHGIELSVFVLTDGKNYIILPEAKDYKRIGEKDTGLNTGGMGAISPVPFAGSAFMEKVEQKIIKPTVEGLLKEKIEYTGFIFIGLMNVHGEPWVIEYNARLGDPETEVVIPRIKNDLVEVFTAAGEKKLDKIKIEISSETAVAVMLVAGGYPEDYEKGKIISGLEQLGDVMVFHAGTIADKENKIRTNGGRVMAVTAVGNSMEAALKMANTAAESIQWDRKYYRKDIGLDLLHYFDKIPSSDH